MMVTIYQTRDATHAQLVNTVLEVLEQINVRLDISVTLVHLPQLHLICNVEQIIIAFMELTEK